MREKLYETNILDYIILDKSKIHKKKTCDSLKNVDVMYLINGYILILLK